MSIKEYQTQSAPHVRTTTMKFTAYLDTTANTLEVYPSTSSRRIVGIEGIKSEGAARAALARRGFTVDAEAGDYAYGTTFTGTASR